MPAAIKMSIGEHVLEGSLNDSDTARTLLSALPITVEMNRWGEEYYGSVGVDLGVGSSPDARDNVAVGELAYWPPGNALCLFFGPTPASVGDEPRAASPVNPVGHITSDVSMLTSLPGVVEATVKQAC